ncbi:type I 3-dehydroquinate dehydratase [Dietzia sp. Cai40]|uniref:type I 3-dehydroquinate dehydratase n=3 Tax=unclassified Dietzia TaxID=2617939 RepID=UPI0015FA8B18|nr:type I 3-dehydroquinate dehydratase [Dietzia sp. Cai40]MBB1041735.1 type I 3-dehydroquinate dehydratase [Dietzia sp. Cai40]
MPRHRLVLDARSPSIIVPLTGRDLTELAEQIGALRSADSEFRSTTVRGTPPAGVSPDTDRLVDVVEWRVDLYGPFTAGAGSDPDPAVQALEQISALLPGLPVLATFRTRSEGGGAEISPEAYVALVEALASTGMAAALDVEYRHPHAEDAITAARRHRTPVVASNHDFDATPPAEEIVARLTAMEDAGADVAKIAVTPRSAADVVTLLSATEERYRAARIPLITMSMGGLGAVTRLGGGPFGSSATFATVGAASAPGQLPAEGVRHALDLLSGGSAPRG